MKFLVKLALIGIIALLFYEAFAVIQARSKTQDIFSSILESDKIEIKLQDLSKKRIKSLLTVQDPKFYEHSGYDFTTLGAGVTTITQAMTKYLYFKKFTKGFKKIEQTLIAWLAITPMVTKDEQLTVFINTAYLGTVDGKEVRGFAEASRVYYKKPFNELTETEYLSIVAMLIAPKTFSLKNHPKRNSKRVELIKKLIKGEYVPTSNNDIFYGQKI